MVSCILFSLFCVGALLAAELEPALESALTTAGANQSFNVIVKLHSPRDLRALDRDLHLRKAPLAERHRLVIQALKANAAETQPPVRARLDRMKAAGEIGNYRAFWIENLITFSCGAKAILELATDPAVESIGFDYRTELIEPVVRGPLRQHFFGTLDNEAIPVGQRATGATRVNRELGITGHGRLVAGLDTGVDGLHPALASRWRGNDAPHDQCFRDIQGQQDTPYDTWGHGTHTMGTMCGREIRTNGDTITVGAAPDAKWIACNAIDNGGDMTQEVLDAFEWFADPDGNANTIDDVPDVIHNSWGLPDGSCFSNWNTAILNCEAAGPVVTWSAGNEGPSANSLRPPARFALSATEMFSIGAVDLSSDSVAPYPIADFSSRGPSGCAPNAAAIKPEIVAPGVDVYSSYPNNSYTTMSGTSMAGPHVAGIVALMREACPNCDVLTIKEALMNTAIDADYGPQGDDNTFGMGMVDAYAAVVSVSALGRVDGTITLANGDPLPGVRVQAVGQPGFTLSNAAGYYNLVVVEEGSYTVNYTKFGYQTQIQQNVQIVAQDTVHISLTMPPTPSGILAGTVITQSGFPVAGARVSFTGTPLDTLLNNASGQFVQSLPINPYSVHIRYSVATVPPRIYDADTTVTVTAADTTHVILTLPIAMCEPSPADAYGYRVYDRFDRALPCPYDWVDIRPSGGGHGTAFTYPHADSAAFFAAPFPMIFYGWLTDSLTVNCNGWMLPGIHRETGRINTRIPSDSAGDPPGIIAPLWGDFDRGFGESQYSYFDSAGGRWIFEFVSQRLLPNHLVNTWEVQLLDPAFYPTATGDCEMRFLYGSLSGSGSCTVGLENPAENTGVQVQRTVLSDWSWPVQDQAALRVTTGHVTEYGQVTLILSLNPPPAEGTTRTVRFAGRLMSASGTQPLVIDSVPAAPSSGVLQMAGYERARVDQVEIDAGIMNTVFMDAWRLDPARELSAGQNMGAVTLSWRRPECQDYAFNPGILYSVYRNDTLIAKQLADTVFTDQPLPNGRTVTYKVGVHYTGAQVMSAPLVVTIDLAVAQGESVLPTEYKLFPNYPNPFNPETRIRLDIPATAFGRLEVYDLQGRLVKTLYSGTLSAGRYQYAWASDDQSGRHVASGLYFCRFSSAHYTATQKMMLVK
jgi:hypothetical protein